MYVEALDNYVCLVTETNKYTVRSTITQFEKVLPPHMFCRIHRSYIISLYHIKAFNKSVVFFEEIKLPVSDQYKDDLLQSVLILAGTEHDVVGIQQGEAN